jgi:hypothetical protein
MILTKHAEIRLQQRCIPELALELLIRYGNVEHQPGGTELVHFKEKSYARARKDLEITLRELDKLRDAYLVTQHAEEGEIIITAGYLSKSPRTKTRKR